MIHIDFKQKVNLFDLNKPWGRLMYQPKLHAWRYEYSQTKHERERTKALNKGRENINSKSISDGQMNKMHGKDNDLEL
ncbi:hypothetical protein [Limosilactobacillus coleohominis]|uniref:Uncharacterized protein n=1 Tax=Limosilactobacillus coleohominis TaxID=181675 RepID=A0ABS2GW07_9LACO|nr:hypothetical protein [Limosilactobacillus coleohominis]MBM6940056.1 hypothetical protein [Limosilactobacillus coleohominis]